MISQLSPFTYLYWHNSAYRDFIDTFTGYRQTANKTQSLDAQIAYEEYLRSGYERQFSDWDKNVGSKGRTIRYPELSYPGKIASVDTSIARAGFDYDTAIANYERGIYNKAGGLYRTAGRYSRYI